MSVKNYGVLKARANDSIMGRYHYQILVVDENNEKYRIAINVKSEEYPSEVLYFIDENFQWGNLNELSKLQSGFVGVNSNNQNIALDYVRGNLFNPKQMIPLPAMVNGPDNDLNEKIDFYVKEAIKNNSLIYAYGQKWGPEENKIDSYFNFKPGNGIHDIHMNQGNTGKWKEDNGIWQDGGMLIYFEKINKWVGIFLAFQSQSWCTDNKGNAIKPVSECNYKNSKNCIK